MHNTLFGGPLSSRPISAIIILALLLPAVAWPASVLAASGDTERVSVDSSGTEGNISSQDPSISSDGRYVAFASNASNLVASDTNGDRDIFVRDLSTGITERISVDSSGAQSDGGVSDAPSISSDGRYVAFESLANNLVALDTLGVRDIFVHDRNTGITERVSVDSSGAEGNSHSFAPSISSDGRYVAFESGASNLVAGDSNGVYDIFVHDRSTGITERVSVDSGATQSNGLSYEPSISGDGRYVAFTSSAINLVLDDTNGRDDIFVHDRSTGVTERVSLDSSATQGNGHSALPSLSSDGLYVAFESDASNLVAGDSNSDSDVFVHDRSSGDTERISVDSSGAQGGAGSFAPSISSDGRYVAFEAESGNLVAGDSNGGEDVFVHDRSTGITARISVDSSGTEGNSNSLDPSISSDGRYVAFESEASNLVAGDSNTVKDIFRHDFLGSSTESSEAESGNPSISMDIAATGTTTLSLGDIIVTVPASAVAGLDDCRLGIEDIGTSGQFGFALNDTVWDVDIVCDGVNQHIFFAPITVCIRPDDGLLNGKQVFHRDDGGGSFSAMPLVDGLAGYVCAETRVLSLFTLGSVSLPATGFAPDVQAERGAKVAYAATGLTLDVPTLDVTLPIVGVPQEINGWDVSWLGNSAGFLQGTAFPTFAGNTVITAHVWGADNQPGPFAGLESLRHGDRFSISAWGQTYTYEVRSNASYSPNALSPLGHADYDWVTLITCEGFDEASGEYAFRRVVRAVLISVD